MKDASLHKFDVLLIWKLGRAFRSISHASNTIQSLNACQVGFRSFMDPAIDTTTPNGQLLFNILASVSQFEKDLTIQRVNASMDYARAHGTKPGKQIGRPALDIPLLTICKAIRSTNGNYTEAPKLLNKECNQKMAAGFVSLRVKRAGSIKNEISQTEGDILPGCYSQELPESQEITKEMV